MGLRSLPINRRLCTGLLPFLGGFLAATFIGFSGWVHGVAPGRHCGLCSLALNSLSVACKYCTISYGMIGVDFPSYSLQFMFLLRFFMFHQNALVQDSGAIFQSMFVTDA